MPQLIYFICSLIILIVFNSAIAAKEQTLNEKPITPIEGKWEGNLVVNDNKSGILWNFNTSGKGQLIGFMGPMKPKNNSISGLDLIIIKNQ